MRDSTEGNTNESDGTAETTVSEAPAERARELLEAVRYGERIDGLRQSLAELDEDELHPIRTDIRQALAFWFNIYNASAQLFLERRPELFESRWRFFRAPATTVAGVEMSLDDIEHGILRGGRSKYGLGYLPRVARTGLGSSYKVESDPRVYFALSCGAASCPAILLYAPETIDETLNDATKSSL